MSFTQIKIKSEVKDKLRRLADAEGRTMANMAERLIDTAIKKNGLKQPQQPQQPPKSAQRDNTNE